MIEPATKVFGAFEAFVGHVSPREGPAHADESRVRIGPEVRNVCARGWSAVEAAPKQKPAITPESSTAIRREKPSYHPRLLDQPMCRHTRQASHSPTTLRIPDGHGRGVLGMIAASAVIHDPSQMQGYLFDGVSIQAHEPVELGALGQVGKRASQMVLGVAIEVSLAGEPRPAGEDGEGADLALGKGGLGAGTTSPLGAVGLAELIDD